MKDFIQKILNQAGINDVQKFNKVSGGTIHEVFSSKDHIIRIRPKTPQIALFEATFLEKVEHPLIPKVIWSGIIDGKGIIVESKLLGSPLSQSWRELSSASKQKVIQEIFDFTHFLGEHNCHQISAVSSEDIYPDFYTYLITRINKKFPAIIDHLKLKSFTEALDTQINSSEVRDLFTDFQANLIHGDLLMQNILIDGDTLTGIVDWEMALCGDPDYDLFRWLYYRECAQAYFDRGEDSDFELDFMDDVLDHAKEAGLIPDSGVFWQKYSFLRNIFYLDAFHWAITQSKDIGQEVSTLLNKWEENNQNNKNGET